MHTRSFLTSHFSLLTSAAPCRAAVTAAWILTLPGSLRAAETPQAATSFDNAEALQPWSFWNGAEFPGATGSIAWASTEGRERPGCLALRFSFVGGGNYVQAGWNLPTPAAAQALTLWIKKPTAHRITFRATDSTDQTFQKTVDYDFQGWQQIEVNLSRWTSHWGGANDGKVKLPFKSLGILVENSAEPRQGTIFVDDVALSDKPAGRGSVLKSTYTVKDFTREASGGKWDYAFTDARRGPSLAGGITLLGEPDAMRLVLQSDGSGHAVHVELNSHFQTFFRKVGALEAKGPQTIEIPLGNLDGWDHSGMENDGKVRYPLRINRIWLERRTGGPKSGSLQLGRLEADIHFDARNAVQLRPAVLESGGDIAFSLELQNIRSTPAKGRLVCEYRNLTRGLDAKAIEMELPAHAEIVRKEFVFPRGADHMVEAAFQWMDPQLPIAPVSIGVSAAPADPGSSELKPESLIGCGLYLYRWHGNPAARENMTRIAELARRAGIKWTREEFQWSAIEPRPGEFRFDFYDQVVDIAHAHGISVYGLLCYWAPWAKANTQEGLDQYCNWVRQVVRRYKGKIKHWEIWNEPNIFFWSGPKELYPKLLTQAYAAVKAEDPDAQVLGCSTAGIDTGFIKMTMEKGGKFDALTIHPYRGNLEEMQYIKELKDAAKLVGGRDVWLTEIGFPSQLVTGWSERRQASLAARTYLASLASDAMRSVSWYDFRNDGPDPYENEQNFGLVRHDFRLKPAYRALATVCRILGDLRVKEQVEVGEGAYAFRFSDGQRDVIAACAPDIGRLLTFETNAPVSAVDGFEQPLQLNRDGARITLTLDAGFPVFMSGPKDFAFKTVAAPVQLKLSSGSVRPGEAVHLQIKPSHAVQQWDLPYAWPAPIAGEAGVYTLQVPADASPGRVDMSATVGKGSILLRLPFTIRIASPLLRV